MRARKDKRIWVTLLGLFVMVFTFTFLAQKFDEGQVEAANMSGFDAGYIISDYQMGNYNSMTESQIQSFLKSKNPCNDTKTWQTGNNIGRVSESTPYSWHVSGGHYVCMADEVFNGGTAAHIIWRAAQDYRINPQVLIVLLQKEQGLVTDTLPNSVQYRSATGFGCPDTAACSSKYYGFKNQVRNAAALFREVLDGGWTNYPLGNNYVRYSPNASCGGTTVNIRNRATSALYRYTPYQPNAAALTSSYGGGDGCSAYGNRNFYSYFEDWFGGIKSSEAKSRGQTISDGIYQFIMASSSGKAMDIEGGAYEGITSGQTDIYSRKTEDMDSQLFEVKYDKSTGYYNISNPGSGLMLDVANASMLNEAQIILWPKNGGCNQDWVIKPDSNGNYTIVSRCSSKVLDATAKNDVVLYEEHGGGNQKWTLAKIAKSAGQTISDGVYQFLSAGISGKALDIKGGVYDGMASGQTDVYGRKTKDMDNQLFEVRYNKNSGYYNIINKTTGLYLDVSGGFVYNDTPVVAWRQNGSCNQDWVIKPDGNGSYTIISRCSSKVLDATAANKIVMFGSHGGSNQKWVLAKIAESAGQTVSDGVYQIISGASQNKAVDVAGGVYAGMTSGNLIIYNKKADGGNNQRFEVHYNKNSGYYNIVNPATGLFLDVTGGWISNDAPVVAWRQNGSCNQDWVIKPDGNGSYTIISRCSSKVLDATAANKIVMFGSHGGSNQKWKFLKL